MFLVLYNSRLLLTIETYWHSCWGGEEREERLPELHHGWLQTEDYILYSLGTMITSWLKWGLKTPHPRMSPETFDELLNWLTPRLQGINRDERQRSEIEDFISAACIQAAFPMLPIEYAQHTLWARSTYAVPVQLRLCSNMFKDSSRSSRPCHSFPAFCRS